jgi:uncharacterized protein (TIGR04141 family)
MQYTFYVFKRSVTLSDDVFAAGKLSRSQGFEQVTVSGVSFTAQAYIQRNVPSTPTWLPFILANCAVPTPNAIRNRSNSFVLVVKTKSGRLCALTYGRGFQALDRDKVEKDFGLDAACRLLKSTAIKEIESKAVGADGLHKLQVASRPGDLATFPLQRARDQVHRLGGKSPGNDLGTRLSGGTSCMIAGKLAFADLGTVCERLVASTAGKPNSRLAALRPFEPVNDATTVAALQKRLLNALTPARCETVGIFLPEIEDWRRIDKIEVSWDTKSWNEIGDLDSAAVTKAARDAVGKKLKLEDLRIRALHDGHTVVDEAMADLATFETDYNKKAYALKDGQWYLLRQDYVDRFSKDFANIEVEHTVGYLPVWPAGHSEGTFNTNCGANHSNRLFCLDRQGIDVAGDPVESCDLVTIDGHFVHVKKWSSSQTFSALIKQGQNSATFLDGSQEFRDGVVAKLPAAWRGLPYWQNFSAGAKPSDMRIIFAIGAKATRSIPHSLPFFSKQSLFDACAALRAMYFNVRVLHVHH